jgi:hypothetical protein
MQKLLLDAGEKVSVDVFPSPTLKPKDKNIRTELYFYLLTFVGVKHGLLP